MNKTKSIVFSGLFAALICIATVLLKMPLNFGPQGAYYNLGDCFVILAGVILGPFYGMASAAIGSGIADIVLGSAIYAPATVITKGLMGLVVGFIVFRNKKYYKAVIAAMVAELLMIAGYFLYELILYGFEVALLSVPGNIIQGVLNIVIALIMILIIYKNKAIGNFFSS